MAFKRTRSDPPMTAGRAGNLCLVGWLILVGMGCGRGQSSPPCPPTVSAGRIAGGETCVRDPDCMSGFCDRGVCINLIGPRALYGVVCDPRVQPSDNIYPPGTCAEY